MDAELTALRAELAAERAARNAAETQLRAIAGQQQILLDATPFMIWFKDISGRYVFCSDAFLQFLNLARDQVIGQTAAALFPADYAADVEANDQKALQAGAVQLIAGYVRKGSRLCWIETQKQPVYDAQGHVLGVLGTSIDVTARQATEELLARHARCAEGLARCSQDLLRDRSHLTPTTTALAAALQHLRHAVDADGAAIYTCPPPAQGPALPMLVNVHAAAATVHCPEQLVLPERVQIALEARCAWGGAAPHADAQPNTPPTLTLLLLPLHVDGAWWGCLALYRSPTNPAWHPQELQALEVATEMIGAFVQSRNKTTALHRRIAELTALNRIVQIIAGGADLRRDLTAVGLLIGELFRAALVTFWLYDEHTAQLRHEVSSGPPHMQGGAQALDCAASPIARRVLAQSEACIIDAAPADPLFADGAALPALVTRMQFWAAPLGIMVIHAATPAQRFAATEIALAETIAGTLASALTNTRLLATEQRQRRLAESLRQIALDLSGSLDLASLTSAIFTQLERVLPCKSAAVLLYHDAALHVTAGMGSAAQYVGRRIDLDSAYPVIMPFHTRRPLVSMPQPIDTTHNPDEPTQLWFPWESDAPPCRWIGVPLMRGQAPLGVLTVNYCATDTVDDEVLTTLQTFASHVAIAIDNAQRYQAAAELAAERERQHLARELHDSVSQSLYFANLAAEALPVIWELDPEEGRQRLDELQRFTRSAQAEMHTLLIELRPSMLVDLPLHDALWRLIAVLTAKTAETQLDVRIGLVPALLPDVQIALYRIAQEALNNVMKHARAAQVQFHLDVGPAYTPNQPWKGTLTLVIADNGRGFNPAQPFPGRLGLSSLAERAAGIGAHVSIQSTPGGGTRVCVVWEGRGQEAGRSRQHAP